MDADEVRAQLSALHTQSFAWAMTCCGRRREDAEDVLHDVYAGLLGAGSRSVTFDGRSTFKTWLFSIIARTARSRARRERLRAVLGVVRSFRIDAPSAATLPDEDAIAADERARTRRALDRLSARQREVLLLVFYHELTIEAAASVMRVSIGSARVHYERGKQRLAMLLGGGRV